ncbi:ribonuclease P protein component [Longilinea arvoryzae]|uniref:ribonuclease P protein component n=1 Tax=Longilinea arvoryzae TaxID=360412 RepID=UPI00094667B8
MRRRFRLSRSTDFKRVRRIGKSYAHPLVVLVVDPNPEGGLRIGVSAGRTVGNAVLRNRAKRRLRAAIDGLLPTLKPGKDLIFLARSAISTASYIEIQAASKKLLERAGLLQQGKGSDDRP